MTVEKLQQAAEQQYSVTELAIVKAIQQFAIHLVGRSFSQGTAIIIETVREITLMGTGLTTVYDHCGTPRI